jgi:hypothetical protein
MTDAPTHEAVLASIVETRGGRACFTVEQLAIASAVSHLLTALADGDPAGAANVATLIALLPPPREPLPPVDLSLLSDRELSALERLIQIGTGERPRIEHNPRSRRYWAAFDLVASLDKIEARGTPITDDEIVTVRNAVLSLAYPVTLPAKLWECYLPAPVVPAPAVENIAPAAVPKSPRVPAATNVIPLDPRGSAPMPR